MSVPDLKIIQGMPIISLWQPWASWVMLGWKTIETRTHDRFRSLRGKRIGIHAALKLDPDWPRVANPYLTDEQIERTHKFLNVGGAIIGTAEVFNYGLLSAHHSDMALTDCHNIDRYGLFLRSLETIEAIPAKGKQGIWYLPMESEEPETPATHDSQMNL